MFCPLSLSYKTPDGHERRGVASNWLDRLSGLANGLASPPTGAAAAVFLRKSGTFAPPEDPAVPLLMIGPGTGVAPFRGFLQLRSASASASAPALGDAWLFFGCRRKEEDYIYGEELERLCGDSTTTLVAAFSRETPGIKVYVQHRMRERAAELAELLVKKGGHVFVCGDGARMAKDVHAALEGAWEFILCLSSSFACSAPL